VSRKLSVPRNVVKAVYKSYWQFIRDYISGLSLEDLDSWGSQATNFNLPCLGKLYTTKDKIKRKNNKLNLKQDVENKINQTDRQSDTSK
jgi:hypothetical protein